MKGPLKVQYGTIYTENGIGIDNMAVILDKKAGLMKYGDSECYLEKYYEEMIEKYKRVGLEDVAADLLLVKFDRYNGILNIEEICTLVNYMILCSANGEYLMKLLNMDEPTLKTEIQKLKEYEY